MKFTVTVPIHGFKLEDESFNIGGVDFFRIDFLTERRKCINAMKILKTGSKSEINELYSFSRFNTAAQTIIEADGTSSALKIAAEKITTILCGLCFIGYSPAEIIDIDNIVQSPVKLIVKSHFETATWKEEIFSGRTIIDNKEKSRIKEEIKHQGFLSLIEYTSSEKKGLKERILRALEWYRKAAFSHHPLDIFLFLWFGIEQLIPKYKAFSLLNPFKKDEKKRRKQNILKRFKRSIFKICRNIKWESMSFGISKNRKEIELKGMQKRKIRFSKIKKMYALRNEIVHEGYLLNYDENKVKLDYLPELIKIFKATILEILELFPSCDSLEEIYQKVQ